MTEPFLIQPCSSRAKEFPDRASLFFLPTYAVKSVSQKETSSKVVPLRSAHRFENSNAAEISLSNAKKFVRFFGDYFGAPVTSHIHLLDGTYSPVIPGSYDEQPPCAILPLTAAGCICEQECAINTQESTKANPLNGCACSSPKSMPCLSYILYESAGLNPPPIGCGSSISNPSFHLWPTSLILSHMWCNQLTKGQIECAAWHIVLKGMHYDDPPSTVFEMCEALKRFYPYVDRSKMRGQDPLLYEVVEYELSIILKFHQLILQNKAYKGKGIWADRFLQVKIAYAHRLQMREGGFTYRGYKRCAALLDHHSLTYKLADCGIFDSTEDAAGSSSKLLLSQKTRVAHRKNNPSWSPCRLVKGPNVSVFSTPKRVMRSRSHLNSNTLSTRKMHQQFHSQRTTRQREAEHHLNERCGDTIDFAAVTPGNGKAFTSAVKAYNPMPESSSQTLDSSESELPVEVVAANTVSSAPLQKALEHEYFLDTEAFSDRVNSLYKDYCHKLLRPSSAVAAINSAVAERKDKKDPGAHSSVLEQKLKLPISGIGSCSPESHGDIPESTAKHTDERRKSEIGNIADVSEETTLENKTEMDKEGKVIQGPMLIERGAEFGEAGLWKSMTVIPTAGILAETSKGCSFYPAEKCAQDEEHEDELQLLFPAEEGEFQQGHSYQISYNEDDDIWQIHRDGVLMVKQFPAFIKPSTIGGPVHYLRSNKMLPNRLKAARRRACDFLYKFGVRSHRFQSGQNPFSFPPQLKKAYIKLITEEEKMETRRIKRQKVL